MFIPNTNKTLKNQYGEDQHVKRKRDQKIHKRVAIK